MEYEYEKRIRSSVELELFRDGRHSLEYDAEVIKELKEVYAKAKAFDEVIKKVETEFVSEDLADSIRILVNDYEYDMEDK